MTEELANKIMKHDTDNMLDLRNDYSGRFMFGTITIGIVGPRYLLEEILEKLPNQETSNIRWDNMGKQYIIY